MTLSTEQKVIGSIAIITIVVFIGGVALISSGDQQLEEKLNTPLMGEVIPIMGAQHVGSGEKIEYNSNPPTSGPHTGDQTAGPGIKDAPVADLLLLHSMEHGAAIVHYNLELSGSDIERIKTAFNVTKGKKIMVPRANLDVPVALTSWGQLLKLNAIDEETIIQFIEINNDRAPEKAPI